MCSFSHHLLRRVRTKCCRCGLLSLKCAYRCLVFPFYFKEHGVYLLLILPHPQWEVYFPVCSDSCPIQSCPGVVRQQPATINEKQQVTQTLRYPPKGVFVTCLSCRRAGDLGRICFCNCKLCCTGSPESPLPPEPKLFMSSGMKGM